MNKDQTRISKRKIQQNIITLMLLFVIILPILSPLIISFAEDNDGGEKKIKEEYGTYAGDDEYTHEVLGKFAGEDYHGREKEDFAYVFSRVAVPSYIYDVSSGVIAKKGDKSQVKEYNGGKFLCDPAGGEYNLVTHNCNIPNFSSQLGQSVMRVVSPSGIVNGERKNAKPMFSWGVPAEIPGNNVPIDPALRNTNYTGLEILGYNLKYTDYNGEWDDIIPSTEARLLSNFGFMDNINLTGTTIVNGVKSGMSEFIEGLEWNPFTWLGNITNAFEVGSSAGLLTIIDTSDMNIATTHGWVRSGQSTSSFYNVYVLSDKEILEFASLKMAKMFGAMLNAKVNSNPELSAIFDLEEPPHFVFDPDLETEASKKARAKAEADNKDIDAYNASVDSYNASRPKDQPARKKKDHVAIPEKKIVPEEEQFEKWKKSEPRVAEGAGKGIDCGDTGNSGDFEACWTEKWTAYRDAEFNASSAIIQGILKLIEKEVMESDPYADTTKAVSHYACADEKGKMIKDSMGQPVYAYKENKDGVPVPTGACGPIRPTLEAGYFGTGRPGEITDTRHVSRVGASGGLIRAIPIFGGSLNGFASLLQNIAKLNAQLLNELINLAFSPLMEKLGITTIVKSSIESFKKTIFYPFIVIAIMFAALSMLFNVIRQRSLKSFFVSFLSMLVIFLVGVILLNSPDKLVDFVDKVPAEAETKLAGLILGNGSRDGGLCVTDSSDKNAGVRSAQCNIWQTLVFQPWTYGQFGTNYNNLYSNGNAPLYGDALENKNQDLVGDAKVNLGGGNIMNNWAVYQANEMTSGTITGWDKNNPPGSVSKNLYKVVDVQAGPNNGKLSDGRYFDNWTGRSGVRLQVAVQSGILSIFMLFAVGSLLLLKIQLTLVFSLLLLGLPFMLLYGVVPKGKLKLIGYGAVLLSLLIKRILATFMVSLMLLMLNTAAPANADGYGSVFFASMIVVGFFHYYKKEILNLFRLDAESQFAGNGVLSGNPDAMNNAFEQYVPRNVRHQMARKKASMTGAASGALGGAFAGMRAGRKHNKYIKDDIKHKGADSVFINSSPEENKTSVLQSALRGATLGKQKNQRSFESRTDNKLTREGLTVVEVQNKVKDRIHTEGLEGITREGSLENEVYKEILANQELESQRIGRETLADQDKSEETKQKELSDKILSKPKQQRAVRKIAKKASKEIANKNPLDAENYNKEILDDIKEQAGKFDEAIVKQSDKDAQLGAVFKKGKITYKEVDGKKVPVNAQDIVTNYSGSIKTHEQVTQEREAAIQEQAIQPKNKPLETPNSELLDEGALPDLKSLEKTQSKQETNELPEIKTDLTSVPKELTNNDINNNKQTLPDLNDLTLPDENEDKKGD